MISYELNTEFSIHVGFAVNYQNISSAANLTNNLLTDLPASLYRSLDYKTTSAIIGSLFCESLAFEAGAIVNPIEKGHPDILPMQAQNATEEQLRNYPTGIEVKCTVGNVYKGSNLSAGTSRLAELTGITWQAHHREVTQLLGMVWDFANASASFNYPAITGIFYSDALTEDDWGAVSGTTGRNTKVSGMLTSGKQKMGRGWVAVIDDGDYQATYAKVLGIGSFASLDL